MLIAYLFVFNLRLNSAISEGNAQMISQSIVLILVHTSLMVEDSVLSFFFYRFDKTLITALVCTMKASFFLRKHLCFSHSSANQLCPFLPLDKKQTKRPLANYPH